MDIRKSLPQGSILSFPGMECIIENEIGRGSNAIVYQGYYYDLLNQEQRHHVLIKELFPYNLHGAVFRDEENHIICEPEATDSFAVHRLSFERGNEVHLRLLEQHPDRIGANLNSFFLNNTLYTVLGFSGGRSLDLEIPRSAHATLKTHARRMLGLLDALDAFHSLGYMHLDISPDNVLLIGQDDREQVVLIDFNSAHSTQELRSGASLYYSTKEGYTAPEVRMGELDAIGPASDLYSVAAVFYHCISGKPLTAMQMMRRTPPDVDKCACMQDLNDSVCSMVRQILRKGLVSLPEKRYQNIEEMRIDLCELIDRIDGVGITHWSLWETGKRNVQRAVRENPSMAYIGNEDTLFPSNATDENGVMLSMNACIENILAPEGKHTLLLGAGGMGKTTALLHAVMQQPNRYSPAQPAITYVSLYGWKDGNTSYIQDRILENLRFKADTVSFENARHSLGLLMAKPLETRAGRRPMLLILLDGLNEVTGNTQALMEEILELSRKRGVRILISSRSDAQWLPFERVRLAALTEDEVNSILSEHGLLLPQSIEIREALKTPMMLSIFLKSAQMEQKQLIIDTCDELMAAYFAALRDKEIAQLPEADDGRWQIDAAISFVLPSIARETHKNNSALSDTQLLPHIARCYRVFTSRILYSVFPQWIGHSRAIRGGARHAEEWYGVVVHELLWRRLGLLVRDDSGNYRVAHQLLEEYLLGLEAQTSRQLRKRRRIRAALQGTALALCIAAVSLAAVRLVPREVQRPAYDKTMAIEIMDNGVNGYVKLGQQNGSLLALAAAAESDGDFDEAYAACRNILAINADSSGSMQERLLISKAQIMQETGEVFAWSNQPLNQAAYIELVTRANSRAERYREYIFYLQYAYENPSIGQNARDYIEKFGQVVRLDADIAAMLFEITCVPQMNADDSKVYYTSAMRLIGDAQIQAQEARRDALPESADNDTLEDCRNALQEAESELNYLIGVLKIDMSQAKVQ